MSVGLKQLLISSYITFFLFGKWKWQWFLMPLDTIAIQRAQSSFVRSMLAPLMIQTTVFPLIKCLIFYRPATARAPEGQQMIPCEYSFMIFYASFLQDTSTKPSTEVKPILKAFYEVVFTDEPLQNLLTLSQLSSRCFIIDSEKGLQMSGSTAITLVFGLICLMTLAIAQARPPPPQGTNMQSTYFFKLSTISLPMVAKPCRRVRVQKDFRIGILCQLEYLTAYSVHSQKSLPTWMTSTNSLPSLLIFSSL